MLIEAEEFEVAFQRFQESGRPRLYTYFKDAPITTGSVVLDDLIGLRGFQHAEIDLPDPSPIAEQVLDELQQQHRLRLALEKLDARCRELLLLVFRDDDDALSYDEVARRLAIPVGSVGPTRARCLGKLRTLVR